MTDVVPNTHCPRRHGTGAEGGSRTPTRTVETPTVFVPPDWQSGASNQFRHLGYVENPEPRLPGFLVFDTLTGAYMTQNIGQSFRTNAVCFQTTADDLQQIAQGILNQPDSASAATRKAATYMMSVPVLRGLATECALKALSARSTGKYEHTHDLVKLYVGLPDQVKRIVESIATNQGVLPPLTILKKHRKDFVDWRYPSDDGSIKSSNMADLPKALVVLMSGLTHKDFLGLCQHGGVK